MAWGPEGVPRPARGRDVPVAAAGARRRWGTEGPWRAEQRPGPAELGGARVRQDFRELTGARQLPARTSRVATRPPGEPGRHRPRHR